MTENNDDSFSSSKAEVFEALGHPTRIRILRELAGRPLAYSELKRAAGMESNGLLTFHLGKMRDLVRLNAESNYSLTDEGREALRIVEASRITNSERPHSHPALHLPRQKALLAALLVVLIVLGSVTVYQQEQILTLNQHISSNAVTMNGVGYRHLTEPLQSVLDAKSILFEGVNFTTIFPNPGQNYSGVITEYNVSAYSPPDSNVTHLSIGVPEIAVRFGTGGVEYWNPFTVTVDSNATTYLFPNVKVQGHVFFTFTQPPKGLWFTKQTNPSAGIEWNAGSGIMTFYVSVS